MHNGKLPAAQPRTLRTIAERKGTKPAGFDGAAAYAPNAGMPAGMKSATDVYKDDAVEAQASATGQAVGATPNPFVNVKKGR